MTGTVLLAMGQSNVIPYVPLCKRVLSHDYKYVLSHDVSHDVVTHDTPSPVSQHSLKDAAMQFFTKKVQHTASQAVFLKPQAALGV